MIRATGLVTRKFILLLVSLAGCKLHGSGGTLSLRRPSVGGGGHEAKLPRWR
jgi:hypothetical protein